MPLFKMAAPSLIFLLMAPGVCTQSWGVLYKHTSHCALNGSSVDFKCTFTYPTDHTIIKTLWVINAAKGVEGLDISAQEEYTGRYTYLGDSKTNCTMKLEDVKETDVATYYFRFKTSKPTNAWLGNPVRLSVVTGLQVKVPESVVEGKDVILRCNSICSLSNKPNFIWYKNQTLTGKITKTNELSFQPVSSEDEGNYSCAVQGHEKPISPSVILSVEYSPKRTSVSVSPSAEVVEGSSVTLTCSSDAKPQVVNYTWFRDSGTSPVGSGQRYTISKASPSCSGLYYCETFNKHGAQNSTTVLITVKGDHGLAAVYAVVGSAVGVALILLGVFLRSRSNRKDRGITEQNTPKQENLHGNIFHGNSAKNAVEQDQDTSNHDDVQYSTVIRRESNNVETSSTKLCVASGVKEDQHSIHRRAQEDEVHYASVQFQRPDTRAVETEEDPSVIYSSVVKKPQ